MLIRTLGVRYTKEVPCSMLTTIFFSIFLFSRQTSLKRGGAADSLTKLKVIIDDDDDTSNYNYA